jgi:ArsR family transcriptional regulator, arsenate/arsenite/antimonite-responsive transcriptional repressor
MRGSAAGPRCHDSLAPLQYFDIIRTMKSSDAISALSALASEARLGVFRLLVKRGPEGYTPSELSDRLGVPAPTLSFHLKELIHAELIVSRRDGRNLYYSPNLERMNALVGFLTENCCSLADEACGPDCKPAVAAGRKVRA